MLPEVSSDAELESRLVAVASRYGEPHRKYHTTDHLMAVLEDVDRLLVEVEVDDPEEVRLAALFHDAVYDPQSSTNEIDSAELVAVVLAGLVPDEAIATVRRLVLATASHQPAALDEAVLLDADLAILGSSREEYAAYVAAVRAEFAHVDDNGWQIGRSRVLWSFLGRDRIFHTPPMAAREADARRNIEVELETLTG
jgi:predicted metal-dependent HD superfamily phosphohydrolase